MKKLFLSWLLLLLVIGVFAQSYKIEVKIKGVENQDIILGHHKNDKLIPVDTVKTDKNGYAVFKGDKPLFQGMYFIFLPQKTYFDILIGEDQVFYIENDTTDLYKNLKAKGSDELQVFLDYHNFLIEQNENITNLREKWKNETDPNKKKELEEEMNVISGKFETYYQEIVTNYPDMFFTTFLKATRDVKVPETITDRAAQYYYYKNHYFENFDVSDKRLYYTNIYESKIDNYLDKVVLQDPDTLIVAVDYLIEKTEGDEELYQYMMIHLFNKYATSNLMIAENMYVHVGEIYAEKATWSTDSFRNELKTKIVRKKNCLIGNKALALRMTILPPDSAAIENLRIPLEIMKEQGLDIEKDKSRTFEEKVPDLSQLIAEYMSFFPNDRPLYDTQSKYTILWFISPDCSHCKKETPLFHADFMDKLKGKDVEVWAIYMEKNTDNWAKFSNDIGDWFDFIEKNKLYGQGWYNMWNPFDNYRFKYDINSSPILYLLDKDKKILAKRIGYEQAIEIILELEKREQ
ncbi:MAG: DUF5106 domain-containing protein [Bacteroidales bacterium]|nr:DUF5106 domain-containing protein [Bacteroidales bacterium]